MPLSFSDVGAKLREFAEKYPIMRRIAENPVFTAICIVSIIMLIVYFVMRDVDVPENTTLTKLCIRAGVYSLIFTITVMFIHNSQLIKEQTRGGFNNEVEQFFGADSKTEAVIGGFENDIVEMAPSALGAALTPVSIIVPPESK